MYIPDDKITAIRNTADIVDIISEVVQLKKAGKNYLGLCPFHSEKTPSFTVSPDKQIFHCFGCNEGGNVFTFLMKHQGLTFPESARMLARRYNIDIPREHSGAAHKKEVSEKETLREINRQAAGFFQSSLADGRQGQKARDYLVSRGIDENIIKTFKLGYAPAGWDNLLRFFNSRGIAPSLAERAGLLAARQSGGYYDRFRDRIIFPITDTSGEVIGFGGRVMDEGQPKYLNSPETPLYNKRRSLYGLEHSRAHCRSAGTVYITEGYMDFLALYRCDIKNVVATLGTALTVEQIRLLKGQADRAIFLFDSDAAGIKAARRGVELFNREKGMDLFILTLPEGHDPDSYLREYGPEQFQQITATALGAVDFLIESAVQQHGLSVEGKLRVVAELQDSLAAVEDSVARALYIKTLAERIGIEERAVWERINQNATRAGTRAAPGTSPGASRRNSEQADPAVVNPAGSGKYTLESRVVAMMLHVPEMLPDIEGRAILKYFENQPLRRIGELILEHRHWIGNQAVDVTSLAEDDEQRRIITGLMVESEATKWNQDGCRKLLDQFQNSFNRGQDDLSRRIKAAEQQKDHDLLDHLLKEKQLQAKTRINIS